MFRPFFSFLTFIVFAGLCHGSVITGVIVHQSGRAPDDTTTVPIQGAVVLLTGSTLHAFSDAEGRYSIEGVPPGGYDVFAYHPDYEGSGNVVVVYADTVRYDWNLPQKFEPQGSCWKPIVRYEGRVTDEATGKPVPLACFRVGDFNYNCGGRVYWADFSGNYEWMLGVEPDTVTVFAEGYRPLQTVVSTNPPDPSVFSHRRDFKLASVGSVMPGVQEVVNDSAAGRFLPDGRVIASRANSPFALAEHPGPFGFIEVEAMDSMTRMPMPHVRLWVNELLQGAQTNFGGRFVIGPVSPGTYTLRGMKNEYNDYYYYPDAPGQTVVVPEPTAEHPHPVARITLWMYLQP